jgi:hypothetical protein
MSDDHDYINHDPDYYKTTEISNGRLRELLRIEKDYSLLVARLEIMDRELTGLTLALSTLQTTKPPI